MQNCYKASYPPGDAREDSRIIDDLSRMFEKTKTFKGEKNLQNIIKNEIKLKSKNK